MILDQGRQEGDGGMGGEPDQGVQHHLGAGDRQRGPRGGHQGEGAGHGALILSRSRVKAWALILGTPKLGLLAGSSLLLDS